MRVLWVHSGSWKSHAAISYIGVHNAWSFAQCDVETHLLIPDHGEDSATDIDLQDFYGLKADPRLHIHRIRLKKQWWHLRHPYFAYAERFARALLKNDRLLVLSREQRLLPVLARLSRQPGCVCLFETHNLYINQSWREASDISRGDRKRSALERVYLPRLQGIVAITAEQFKLYHKALPTINGLALPLGVKLLTLPDEGECEARRARRTVAYIGHLLQSKGIPGMLSVAGDLASHGIRLALFGGSQVEADKLCGDAGLSASAVSCTPFLPPAQMFRALAETASIGIVALEDTFYNRHLTCPVKALDFLALGMPVVASDLPSTREVLGDAALYFLPGDTQQMSSAINRLLGDEKLYAELSRHANARAAALSWEARAKAILIYASTTA